MEKHERYIRGMGRLGVSELRQRALRYPAMVKQGQTVEVTERGELVALLVAPHPSASARNRLIADGRVLPTSHHRHMLPEPLTLEGASNAELLAIERDERLAGRSPSGIMGDHRVGQSRGFARCTPRRRW